jgi:hypothetical protein
MRKVGGGGGGETAAHGESKIDGRKYEDGFVHGFYNFCLQLLSPSPSLGQKKELVHDYEASYTSEFLTLI